MLLLVTIDGERWLVDVGFGGLTLTSVLRLQSGLEQLTAHEPYRLLEERRRMALAGQAWGGIGGRCTASPCSRARRSITRSPITTWRRIPTRRS